jgi:hypothetical protein
MKGNNMKRGIRAAASILAFIAGGAIAQTPLPKEINFKIGAISHVVTDINSDGGGVVTAKITKWPPGKQYAGCQMRAQPAKGSLDGTHLLLRAQVEEGDKMTCPLELDLTMANGQCQAGTWKIGDSTGTIMCQ